MICFVSEGIVRKNDLYKSFLLRSRDDAEKLTYSSKSERIFLLLEEREDSTLRTTMYLIVL